MITFEVVHSDAEQPWHTRIRAGNGEPWFATEQYAEKETARDAATHLLVEIIQPDSWDVLDDGTFTFILAGQNRAIEIHQIDERDPQHEVPD